MYSNGHAIRTRSNLGFPCLREACERARERRILVKTTLDSKARRHWPPKKLPDSVGLFLGGLNRIFDILELEADIEHFCQVGPQRHYPAFFGGMVSGTEKVDSQLPGLMYRLL